MSSRTAIDREALRGLIRQVLQDAVPADLQRKLSAALKSKAAVPKSARAAVSAVLADQRTEEISIASDADLQRFVQRLVALAEDAAGRDALKSGRIKFQLAKSGHRSPAILKRPQREVQNSAPAAQSAGGYRIDRGLVAERHIVAAAKNGRKLTVAKGVAVTPLARDKARQLGVVIERE
ncbi:MAG: hypothetical protein ACKVOI_01835 [Dongiaceae bacterium]